MDDGIDVIEIDVVITKDRVPVFRHENNFAGATGVAIRPARGTKAGHLALSTNQAS